MILSELIDKGGPIMIVIIALSIYVFAVILYKIYQFWRMEAFNTKFVRGVLEYVEDRKYSDAVRIAGNQKNPLARVVEVTIHTLVGSSKQSEDQKLRTIEASGLRELRLFESHLRGLEMAANIAPLLGLLGTVQGLVKAFAGINQAGARVDPSILAGGIWEALLTTVAGLAVAIPALAAHYIFESKIDSIRSRMTDTVSHIISKAAGA